MDADAFPEFFEEIARAIWRDLAPLEPEIEDTEELPYERLFPALRDMGAFGLLVPEELGGSGLTISQYLPIIGEFAKVHGGIRALVHVHNSFAHAFLSLAKPEQRDEIASGLATAETSVAFALTEP